MDYLIAVQAPAYPVSPTRFATESAFAAHLKALRQSIGPRFERVVLIAPRLTDAEYEEQKQQLGTVSAEEDGVVFAPAYPTSVSRVGFWLTQMLPVWRLARSVVRNAGIVHSGMSTQLGHPLMAMVNLAAWLARRPVVFMVDIDFRHHAWRFFKTGQWSLKSYLVNRYVYDPLKWFQVWLAPRMFTLVCLKSASMVRDFGGGRANVKNFFDTVHAAADVLTDHELEARCAWLKDPLRPLTIVYFGRLAANKGMDRAVEAVRIARDKGVVLRLTLVGGGGCRDALQRQVVEAGLDDAVTFLPPVQYGAPLFDVLREAHVSVAAPLIEDTPRAAFDSMARGIPVVAFDITYFRDLDQASHAVALAQWPSAQALAEQFIALDTDRERLAAMARRAVHFARENTQATWLERRTRWILELVPPVKAMPS